VGKDEDMTFEKEAKEVGDTVSALGQTPERKRRGGGNEAGDA